jgi:DNA-binding transcriptional MocR family regulator
MAGTLYERLADDIARQIQDGVYRVGEKLPSIRTLSRQQGVSVATVQQAYRVLEDQRLVEARAKSGYYVRQRGAAPAEELRYAGALGLPSAVSVHHLATEVFWRCESCGETNLGTAYPAPAFLPVRQLQRIAARLFRRQLPELLEAHFSPGHALLRHQIAQRMAEAGCHVSEHEIIVTGGCQEALNLCLRAVAKSGDTIAIETPTFVGLLQAIEAYGMRALEIPTHVHDGISLDALQLALDQWPVKAVALVPAFNNPLGSNMPRQHKARLVGMLAERGVPLIEDDLFGDLAYGGLRTTPAKAYDRNGTVLYCSSFSKSIAPGFRLGWVSPGRYEGEINFLKSFTNVSTPALAQMVVAEFLSTGAYDRHLRWLRDQFSRQLGRFRDSILRHFPDGTRVSEPAGGYILWVELAPEIDAGELCRRAADEGIGVLPGQLCSPTGKFRHHVRLNCAVPWNETTQRALERLGRLAWTLS